MSGGGRCEGFAELVSAFVDESLDDGEVLRLEEHLLACPSCRAFESEVRRLRELLAAAEAFRPHRRPPSGFAAGLAARVAAELPGEAPGALVAMPAARPRWQAWVGLAAAAAALLVFGWSWERLAPRGSGTPVAAVRQAVEAPVPAPTAAAPGEAGSIEAWMQEHTLLARGGTLLGSAEEVEFASFPASGDPSR